MGLGKTVCSLTATQELMDSFDVHRTLVVAPKRVARKTWADEMEKWDHLNMSINHAPGRGGAALDAIKEDKEIMTVGRDNLSWLVEQYIRPGKSGKLEIIQEWPWDQIILDESSSFKSRASQRWHSIYRMTLNNRQMYDRMQQLTGSPAPNGLADVWAPIYLMDQGARLGATIGAYRQRWFEPPNYDHPYTYKPWPSAQAQVEGFLKDICLSMEAEDYLDLPPVMDNWIQVDMTPAEWKIYNRMAKHYVSELSMANGAVYDDERNVHHVHDSKLRAVMELIEGCEGKPVMIFYSYQHDLARIGKALTKAKIPWRKLDTEKDEDDWNAGRIPVMLLHPAGAGHGLNLQDGGELMAWFGLNYSLELYNQAIARLAGGHRRVGKNVINHHIVVPGTADDNTQDSLKSKARVENSLIQAMKRLGLAIVR